MILTCGTCGHRGEDGTTYNHDCYWVFRERGQMHRAGHPGYDDDSQYPDDEPTRIQKLARRAGRLADVVVNRKTLTVAQKDEVVIVLRECERQLLEGR